MARLTITHIALLLCSPVDVETFYDAVHEDAPLLVTRPNNRQYFGGLFSKDGEAARTSMG